MTSLQRSRNMQSFAAYLEVAYLPALRTECSFPDCLATLWQDLGELQYLCLVLRSKISLSQPHPAPALLPRRRRRRKSRLGV
jgi:hypothetical protein